MADNALIAMSGLLKELGRLETEKAKAWYERKKQRLLFEKDMMTKSLEFQREMMSRLVESCEKKRTRAKKAPKNLNDGVHLEETRSHPGRKSIGSGSGSADLPGTALGKRMRAPESGVLTLAEPGPRCQQVESEGGKRAAITGTSHGQSLTPTSGGGKEEPQLLEDIFVTFRRNGRNIKGVIREVHRNGSCKIASGPRDDDEVFTVFNSEVEVIAPEMFEKVKILGGPYQGATGKLVFFDETCGRVLLDSMSQRLYPTKSNINVAPVDSGHFAKLCLKGEWRV